MLVLTRKKGESIVVDGEITITIVEIRGNRVRLAIEAPSSRKIRRGELLPMPTNIQRIEVEGTVEDDGSVTPDEDIIIDDDPDGAASAA